MPNFYVSFILYDKLIDITISQERVTMPFNGFGTAVNQNFLKSRQLIKITPRACRQLRDITKEPKTTSKAQQASLVSVMPLFMTQEQKTWHNWH